MSSLAANGRLAVLARPVGAAVGAARQFPPRAIWFMADPNRLRVGPRRHLPQVRLELLRGGRDSAAAEQPGMTLAGGAVRTLKGTWKNAGARHGHGDDPCAGRHRAGSCAARAGAT
jgi:hypothetical protein